jgi:hypothetical protein
MTAMAKADAFEMEERKEPELIKFADGEVVEGELIAIERILVGEERKPAVRYVLRDIDTNGLVAFIGVHQINQKLRPEDRGHFVSVRYEGEDKTVSRNGNAMKLFKVRVSKQKVSILAPGKASIDPLAETEITDDYIPF